MTSENARISSHKMVFGAKEGATKAITKKVGARVTDTVLRSANVTDYKSVDKFEIRLLVNAILQATDRSRICAVCQHLVNTITFKFNMQKCFVDNIYVLHARITRLVRDGICSVTRRLV